MRCDQHPGCLCYEGDDTTQLYEDSNIPVIVRGSLSIKPSIIINYPPGTNIFLPQNTFEDNFPFPKVGYCWWTKSCTTKDDDYPIIYRVLTIPGGAGFRPSTVAPYSLNTGMSAKGFKVSQTWPILVVRSWPPKKPSSSSDQEKKGYWKLATYFFKGDLGGGFIFFYFYPDPWGDDAIWRAYFSDGLVQPPTRGLI